MDYVGIAAAIVAGGGGGAIITGIFHFLNERKKLQREYYDSQLRNLYGPLYYLISMNEKMIQLNDSHHIARKKAHIDGKERSRDPETRKHLREVFDSSIKIANSYMDEVRENNHKIKKIFDMNYHYLDPEDAEFFIKFLQDFFRMEKEWDKEIGLKTDWDTYFVLEESIGAISFMDKKFAERVKEKFAEKQSLIRKISYCDPKSLLS